MAAQRDRDLSHSRLLELKRALGLAQHVDTEANPYADGEEESSSRTCIYCGYEQEGQLVDRCPECGLLWASKLRDPMRPAPDSHRGVNALVTALRVLRWDRRTRMRTSYVPSSPESRWFSKWCIMLSALLLGVSIATSNIPANGSISWKSAVFGLHLGLGVFLMALLLFIVRFTLKSVLQARWRRTLRLVPATIDYSLAWFPPVAFVVTALLALRTLEALPALGGAALAVGLLGVSMWALWLWASVTESQHIEFVAQRIMGVTSMSAALGIVFLMLIPSSASVALKGFATRYGSLLSFGNSSGAATPAIEAREPRTFALFIDMIPSDDEWLIRDCMAGLGAEKEQLTEILGEQCTRRAIRDAFREIESKLWPEDKLIVYINGHGMENGSGAIRVDDGFLTSQALESHMRMLPTDHVLVVIDSCFAGKFIDRLKEKCDTVVLTSTDDQNVAFRSALRPLWRAWMDPKSDRNLDGQITVDEAVTTAYTEILARAESRRTEALEKYGDFERVAALLEKAGFSTPQLDTLGRAKESDFAIAVSKVRPDPR